MQDINVMKQHPVWKSLQAVQRGRVYALDGNSYINRSGPRLVESADLLAHVIWGEQTGIEVAQDAWQRI